MAFGRAAVVSTMKDVDSRIESWVRWHCSLGFERLYIFVDDAHDTELQRRARAAGGDKVIFFIRGSPALQDGWARQASWRGMGRDADKDIQIRQLLNAQFAFELASIEGLNWLLHIDSDELFLCRPERSVTAHFARLASEGCEAFVYCNLEAVPEMDALPSDDPFLQLDLFKVSESRVPPEAMRALEDWRSRNRAGKFFLYYENGKSACRVDTGGRWIPVSVHQCLPRRKPMDGGDWDDERLLTACWTNDPRNDGVRHVLHEQSCILHYPVWDAAALWRKYALHGNFPDELVSGATHKGGLAWGDCFHTECRDVFVAHRADDDGARGAIRDLFRHAAMAKGGPSELAEQIRVGALQRIPDARELLQGLAAASMARRELHPAPSRPPPVWTAGQQRRIVPWQSDADYAVERVDWRGPKRASPTAKSTPA